MTGGEWPGLEPAEEPRTRLRDDVVLHAVGRFLAWSGITLLVLMVCTVLVGERVAQQQALEDAENRARRLAQTVGKLVTDGVRERTPGAVAPLSRVLDSRFQEGYLARAKLWAADGTVLWSDDSDLVGRTYALSAPDRSLLGTSDVHAELSTLEEAENARERHAEELLEVYAGTFDAEGHPLLFEAYISTEHMRDDQLAIIRGLAPVGIGGLLLFQAAVLPLAVSLGRRVRHSEAARAGMAAHALQASELERKRIAQELHDGVVQDLAGVGFSLPAIRRALGSDPANASAVRMVQQVEVVVQRDISALRSMMIDVYPPDLQHTGLLDAVDDLASAGRARGLAVTVRGIGKLDLPVDVARLVYRVCREGLHNVAKHARAEAAVVTIRREPDVVVVTVADDGRGLQPGAVAQPESLGLRLLSEAVHQCGGTVNLTSTQEPGDQGACLEAVVPLRSSPDDAPQGSSKARRSWFLRWAG
jgi:signal transduction histidine kinase